MPMHALRIKPAFVVDVLKDEVVLIAESGSQTVNTAFLRRLVPLLDGTRQMDDILRILGPAVPFSLVHAALATLRERGFLTDEPPMFPARTAAYLNQLNVTEHDAADRLRTTRVAIATVGLVDHTPIAAALAALGVQTVAADADADLTLVVVESYLEPALHAMNAHALATGTRWLLARPSGAQCWIGPVFVPHDTGCWDCLASVLRRNNYAEAMVLEQRGTAPHVGIASTPSLHDAAVHLTANEVFKIVVGESPPLAGRLLTVDLAAMETRRHELVRLPHCRACGRPPEPRRDAPPIVLQHRSTLASTDGGYRTVRPEETLARFERLVGPLLGFVNTLGRDRLEAPLHVYHSGSNLARLIRRPGSDRRQFRLISAGKGVTEVQAKASAMCEALERYSGEYQGHETVVTATMAALGDAAVDPDSLVLLSHQQYAARVKDQGMGFNTVFDPFRPELTVDWTPVWSLTERRTRYVPTGLCYYTFQLPDNHRFCHADSNGAAAGNTIEEAILQGYLELVERDAVACWWHTMARRPAVDLTSFANPYFAEFVTAYAAQGRRVIVLDVTHDLGIPVMAAIGTPFDPAQPRVTLGFGAHFDPEIAITRALTEMNQMLVYADNPIPASDTSDFATWLRVASLETQHYLVPNPTVPATTASTYTRADMTDAAGLLDRQVEKLRAMGLHMLVLDQTRPEVGLPVVKVFVPGLRTFWARYAPGRLYDVPAALGWTDGPLREADLNPIPVFF